MAHVKAISCSGQQRALKLAAPFTEWGLKWATDCLHLSVTLASPAVVRRE